MMTTTDYELFSPMKQDCLKCFKYISSEDIVFTLIQRNAGDQIPLNSNHNRIFFIIEGKANILFNKYLNNLESGSFILIPRKSDYNISITENSFMVIVNLHHRFIFCEQFPFQKLHQFKKNQSETPTDFYPLQSNSAISLYLQNLITLISAGIKCKYFYEVKQQELFYYFRSYYSTHDLCTFFSPILNDDTDFAELVYQNHESVKTITEFANITHYSVSGFKKRFTRVFGISPQHWMRKEKAKRVYNEIINTQKPFKELSIQYHFCSVSHFNRFCKQMYGISPAKLRS